MDIEDKNFRPLPSTLLRPSMPLGPLGQHQNALLEVLEKKDKQLAQIYQSSILILNQKIPGEIHFAAHGMREVVEKLLWKYSVKENGITLKEDFQNFKKKCNKLCEEGKWPDTVEEINNDLKNFLINMKLFLTKEDSKLKSTREQIKSFLRYFNFSRDNLPQKKEDHLIEEWMHHFDCLKKTAHLRNEDKALFLKSFNYFESILLNCLSPKTFENRNEILEIIREGEE